MNPFTFFISEFIRLTNIKQSNLNAKWLITIVSLFFLWKLLSRDFSIFSDVPYWALERVPFYTYNPEQAFLIFDLLYVTKLVTFHWIHEFIPFPNSEILQFIKYICISSFICIIFFGRGPKKLFAVTSYLTFAYLWGYIFRSGQEVDAVFLPMGILFCYLFSTFKESWSKGNLSQYSQSSSIFIFSSLMIFVIYYAGSGINKLTDIPLNEWFLYDLLGQVEQAVIADKLGADRAVPDFFSWMLGLNRVVLSNLFYVGVGVVYFVHLLSPLIILRSYFLIIPFVFYFVFHFLAFGVGISFTANLLIWIGFVNIKNIQEGKLPYYGYR